MIAFTQRKWTFVSSIKVSILSVPFWFGFFVIFYVAVAGPVKVVDIFGVLFILYGFYKGIVLSPEFFLLFLIIMLLLASTLLGASKISDMSSVLELYLNSVFSALIFVCVSSLKSADIKLFLGGFTISFVIVGLLSMSGLVSAGSIGFSPYLSANGFSIIGTMPDPSRFGFTTTIFIMLAYAKWVFDKESYFWMFALVFGLLLLVANGQRAAFLFSSIGIAFVLGLLLFDAFLKVVSVGRIKKKYLLVAGLFFVIPLFLITFNFNSVEVGDYRILNKLLAGGLSYSDDPRYDKFMSGVGLLSVSPFVGFGFDAYNRLAGAGTSHNSYIEISVAGGGVALGLYILFVSCVACRCFFSLYRHCFNGQRFDFTWLVVLRCMLVGIFSLYFFVLNVQFLVLAYAFLGLCSNPYLVGESVGGHEKV